MEISSHKRIVITGLGILSALGNNPKSVYERMLQAESGIKQVNRFETDALHCSIAGQLNAEDLSQALLNESTASFDVCAKYAVQAAWQALNNSGIDVQTPDLSEKNGFPTANNVAANQIGLILGTCNGGILSLEKQWNINQLDEEHTANYPFYQQGDDTAKALGLNGPVTTMNTACSASGNAIGFASDLIRGGYADVMLAGGSDPLSHSVFAGFNVLRALNPEKVSPFGNRYGLNLGEGAAFVVLEELDHALARGAHIYGELCAYGLSNDAYHETAPHPEGAGIARAVSMALKQGNVPEDAIEYINAHGTGTQANDKAEMTALRQVFGENFSIPVSSSKAYFGHNLGAAAAVELVTTLYAIDKGYLPGTLHFDDARPSCENVDIIGEQMRSSQPEYILNNNAAFGGHNVSLLIRTGAKFAESLKESMEEKLVDGKEKRQRNTKTRVAITGIGAVGHWGVSEGQIYQALHDSLKSGQEIMIGKANFSLKEDDKTKYERRMNALIQYTIGAALRAVNHAELDTSRLEDIGFIYGTARGSTESISRFLQSVFVKGPEYASSIYFPHTVINSVAGKTAQKLNLQDFSSSISTGGNEGLTAALYATEMIRNGSLSTFLIGAGDERSDLSEAIDRAKGLTEGKYENTEGSVCVVLENMDDALAEGVLPMAELKGFSTVFTDGLTGELKDMAITDAVNRALRKSKLSLADVDLILVNSVGRTNEFEWEQQLLLQMGETLPSIPPVFCLNDAFGYAESYSSMLHLAVAAEFISNKKSWQLFRDEKQLSERRLNDVLVISSSVNDNYIATVVSKVD